MYRYPSVEASRILCCLPIVAMATVFLALLVDCETTDEGGAVMMAYARTEVSESVTAVGRYEEPVVKAELK